VKKCGEVSPCGLEARAPARASRSTLVAALAALAILACASAAAQPSKPGSGARALLSRGAEPVRGLPFFSPNAIPSLRAEYILFAAGSLPSDAAQAIDPSRGEALVRVWCTRERLVLGPVWAAISLGAARALSLERAEGPALALVGGRYTLIFESPEAREEEKAQPGQAARSGPSRLDLRSLGAFALAFESKFSAFFDRAASDAELSFPAYVDLPR